MGDKAICRIGVFYDGSYFSGSQKHFYCSDVGWLEFRALHALIQEFVRRKEQGFFDYKVVYGAWFQGLHTTRQADPEFLHKDRNLHHDLMHAGVETKFLPMSVRQTDGKVREKGVDVALAVDALKVGLSGTIDVAVLVTGDADFVPLLRELMKVGVRTLIVYFEYQTDDGYKAFANERLLAAANYSVNINALEKDKEFRHLFQSLFKKPVPKNEKESGGAAEQPASQR
jgi:uncharacterized LabA/DUF88 family protein